MNGYPGLSSYAQNQINELTADGFGYFFSIIMIIICLVIVVSLFRKWKNTELLRLRKTCLALLLVSIVIFVSLLWFGQPTFGLIEARGAFPAMAEVKVKDLADWHKSQKLDTILTALETHLAKMGANPSYNDLELAAKTIGGPVSVALTNCRVINAQLINPEEVNGISSGHVVTGGIFSHTVPLNLSSHATSLPDLRSGQAIIIWAEYNSRYVRLILPSKTWTQLQLTLIKQKYYPPDNYACTHDNEVFRQHYPQIEQDINNLLVKTDGNVDEVWSLLQDGLNKNQPLIIDITSLNGSVREDTYYVDYFQLRSAAHIPPGVPSQMTFPGGVCLSLVERATENLRPFQHENL